MRTHARERGKAFAVTLAEFVEFCAATGYAERVGIEPQSLTVDRINASGPYAAANIQALTLAHNSRKGWFEQHGLTMGDADEEEL